MVATRSDGVVAADGQVNVVHNGTVTVTYQDASDENGVARVDVDTANVDCVPPQIADVQVTQVTGLGATIEFEVSEPARGRIRYGTSCAALHDVRRGTESSTTQQIELLGLEDDTAHFFAVEAEDAAGLVDVDDNGGACYSFTTLFLRNYFTDRTEHSLIREANPLNGQSITFSPDGSPHFYAACRQPVTAFWTDPAGGSPPLPTNFGSWPETFEVILEGGQLVWLYGQSYDRFHVSRYGSINFSAPDSEDEFTLSHHFSAPRVTAMGRFNDGPRGWVSTKQLADRIVITYQYYQFDVPGPAAQDNHAQIELFFDGRIRLTTLALSSRNGFTVGLSEGNGVPPDFVSSTLRASPLCSEPVPSATPLSGRKIKLQYRADGQSEHKLKLDVFGNAIRLPTFGGAEDPTINGATLTLFNPATGERDSYFLPAIYWKLSDSGYRFRAVTGSAMSVHALNELVGPCRDVRWQHGRLRARCEGHPSDGIHFSLDESGGQGALAVEISAGAGPDIPHYCAVFGGRIRRDTWWLGSRAEFKSVLAPPPAVCPTLP